MNNLSKTQSKLNLADHSSYRSQPRPAKISKVEANSIGEAIGLEPGDEIFSINGSKPRDLIDYQFLIVEETICLKVIDAIGTMHTIELEKEADDGLGIEFTEALFDGLKQCNNGCPFCFIDQQPTGKRKSLYFKDDDYRMSFLYGSYLTLTNLHEDDWLRIEKQRLSPLFVSIHSTTPKTRSLLLKNKSASLILKQLDWFQQRNLQIHAQVVVCPTINDGDDLQKTLLDLAEYGYGKWPAVLSTAVVPVGLTRFRPNNDGLIPVNPNYANTIIDQVEKLQETFKVSLGSRFAWLADEWYLIAGRNLPPRNEYEDLPQQENGVGSIRAFLESIKQATLNLPTKLQSPRTCSWVVGKLVKEALEPACKRLNNIEGLTLYLYGLPSPYWGQEQVVTGLLTGKDLEDGLKEVNLGDEMLLPRVMLKEDMSLFLDDMTVDELSQSLDIPIRVVNGADEIISTLIG